MVDNKEKAELACFIQKAKIRIWKMLEKAFEKIVDLKIVKKWHADKSKLPLTHEHWELYFLLHRCCYRELQEFPNLIVPRDFNDRIQWLKLFDQTDQHVRCSDKILVRDHVRERVGEKYLVQLYQTCKTFDEIKMDSLPKAFVIKTNHDSGTVILVKDKCKMDRSAARQRIKASLERTFGWQNGEWAYAHIQPRILVEEYIAPEMSVPPADYKFYVVEGLVKFVHFISDRGVATKEQPVSADGQDLGISLYPGFIHGSSFQKPSCWEEMKTVAEKIAAGFKCVRVDLFENEGKVFAGEMTFWPMFGCYKGEGQKRLGQLLDFDRTTFKPPIYNRLPRHFR